MAFLQKKPLVSTSMPLYTVSAQQTLLIIGLGNPGKKYTGTRHNIGFSVVDEFARANGFPKWSNKKSLLAEVTVAPLAGKKIILVKPSTYMNDSGQAARLMMDFYKLTSSDILAVYDELALNFGQLRTRIGGSDAGHNGVKSLISHIGSEFGRLRIGIANNLGSDKDSSSFVLGKFTKEEQAHLAAVINEACVMLTEYIYAGSLSASTSTVL